jgi:hypothetical protein
VQNDSAVSRVMVVAIRAGVHNVLDPSVRSSYRAGLDVQSDFRDMIVTSIIVFHPSIRLLRKHFNIGS